MTLTVLVSVCPTGKNLITAQICFMIKIDANVALKVIF